MSSVGHVNLLHKRAARQFATLATQDVLYLPYLYANAGDQDRYLVLASMVLGFELLAHMYCTEKMRK